MFRYFIIILVTAISFAPIQAQKKGTSSLSNIKKQQAATEKAIKETANKIKQNTNETRKSLNELNSIKAEIGHQEKSIKQLTSQLNEINVQLAAVKDSIDIIEKDLTAKRAEYGKAVKKMHSHSSAIDRLQFIFSAKSFNQAMRRTRYLHQYSKWKRKQLEEIKATQQRLQDTHDKINALANQKNDNLNRQNVAKLTLEQKKHQQNEVVKKLKKEGANLQKVLADKQRQAQALDRELNRIIAAQERAEAERQRKEAEAKKKQQGGSKQEEKIADTGSSETKTVTKTKTNESSFKTAEQVNTALTGSFEANKGKMPFPVSGNYRIVRHFGIQQHPELQFVKTENGGIDIETSNGAVARAVFGGKVSAVFRQDGFNTVVMVRHGNYLTIYVNLSDIYVRTGDTVKMNQNIGRIFSDPDDGNRTILHFEVRKETQKLNPEAWLRH